MERKISSLERADVDIIQTQLLSLTRGMMDRGSDRVPTGDGVAQISY